MADHARFHDHFGCDRILHKDDLQRGTQVVEIQLVGAEPSPLASDLLILPVPGHTKGHTVLIYCEQFLFSGDHLAWSPELNHLQAFRRACWHSWKQQIESMRRLGEYSFEWVLPGHGRRYHANRETMRSQMQQYITWMEQVA